MNLQNEGMLELSSYTFLLRPIQCHILATTLTKVLVQRKQMDDHMVYRGTYGCVMFV